jgi:hypothetical protein
VNIVLFLINDFHDKISFKEIAGVRFSERVANFIISSDGGTLDEEGAVTKDQNFITWTISEDNLIVLLARAVHQLGYNSEHIHICRDKEIEIFCELNS